MPAHRGERDRRPRRPLHRRARRARADAEDPRGQQGRRREPRRDRRAARAGVGRARRLRRVRPALGAHRRRASTRSSPRSSAGSRRARTTTRTASCRDQPETTLVAELLREQLLAIARDELPHSIVVTAEVLEDDVVDGTTTSRTTASRGAGGDPALPGRRPGRARLPEGDRHRQGWRRDPRRRDQGPPRARDGCSARGCTWRPPCGSTRSGSAAPIPSTGWASDAPADPGRSGATSATSCCRRIGRR